ncbi:MAG: DUF4139 domain-containing protein [Methylococcales bacterium]|nr:DUF4139 domain-containing protein [Methylococcales bacterium]
MQYSSPVTLVLIFYLALFSVSTNAEITEKKTTLDDQTKVAITIYNNDLALIKDQRKISLDKGNNRLAFRGVSAKMRPETAMLRSLTHGKGFNVIEQNFDYDLLTPAKLLDKYVGQPVRLVTTNPATGNETKETAIVLSTHQGVVLKIGNRIKTNPKGQFVFDNIPENLRDQPTLVTQLNSSTSQAQQVELSYLSGGLSWKADYVAELSANDNSIDLLGWVTLNNKSGADYNNATLQLVAGDVNRVKEQTKVAHLTRQMEYSMAADAGSMSEESLFEYHLYSLNRPTSILNNQTKQVSLLSANSVPVTKELILNGANYYYSSRQRQIAKKLKVGVFVQLENKKKAGLGMPIPKGIVRVYKKDSQGNAQFIGEDHIDHTPKNETIRLKLGDAFDITVNKKQTNFAKRKHILPGKNAFESSFQIELKNAKSTAVTISVREPIPADWKMLKESHPHKKVAAGTAEWKIKVPAEGSTVLDYRVLVEY